MLGQRLRRWPNIIPALCRCLVRLLGTLKYELRLLHVRCSAPLRAVAVSSQLHLLEC